MSLANFIPSVWSAQVARGLENNLVAARLANRSFEGEISQAGDRVKVNMFADPTISAYTKYSTSLTYEELTSSQRELIIDQSNSFAFKVEDIDTAQANIKSMSEPINRASYGLANAADAYVLGLYAQAGMTNTTPTDLVSTNVEEDILKIGRAFNEAGLPFQGRALIVAPWVIDKMVLAGLTTKTANDQMWANGFVDRILGFNVYMSQNVSKNSASWDITRNLAIIEGESIGYADQIVGVEALRLESSFSDAVRGLHLFGAKIMRPDKTYLWLADYTAEA